VSREPPRGLERDFRDQCADARPGSVLDERERQPDRTVRSPTNQISVVVSFPARTHADNLMMFAYQSLNLSTSVTMQQEN
jgi:hypothetical protein